jgi:superfamily II DNA helicase RecQ
VVQRYTESPIWQVRKCARYDKTSLILRQAIMKRSRDILHDIWGYSFRPLQEDIVDNVIYGHDTVSRFCLLEAVNLSAFRYQAIAREGITVVIVSPLIALMQDQVQNLKKRGVKAISSQQWQ